MATTGGDARPISKAFGATQANEEGEQAHESYEVQHLKHLLAPQGVYENDGERRLMCCWQFIWFFPFETHFHRCRSMEATFALESSLADSTHS